MLAAGRQHRTLVRLRQGLTEHVRDGGRRLSPCGVDSEEEAQFGIVVKMRQSFGRKRPRTRAAGLGLRETARVQRLAPQTQRVAALREREDRHARHGDHENESRGGRDQHAA